MKNSLSYISILFFLCLSLSNCTRPTYPKEEIEECVKKIVKSECNLESEAKLIGNTFYLSVALPDLLTTEANIQKVVLKKLSNVNLAITRVSLSTDAKIDYLVLLVDLPGWKTSFSIAQRMDDLKGFIYQRISRGDYEERVIYDFKESQGDKIYKDWNLPEFVAELIASKFNWITMTNPFLNAVIGFRLNYYAYEQDKLILILNQDQISPLALTFLESTIKEWSDKIIKKYEFNNINEIDIINNSKKLLLNMRLLLK